MQYFKINLRDIENYLNSEYNVLYDASIYVFKFFLW